MIKFVILTRQIHRNAYVDCNKNLLGGVGLDRTLGVQGARWGAKWGATLASAESASAGRGDPCLIKQGYNATRILGRNY